MLATSRLRLRLGVLVATVAIVLSLFAWGAPASFPGRASGTGRLGDARTPAATPSVPIGQWIDLTSSAGTPPSPRQASSVAYDPLLNEIVLFGGQTSNGAWLGDTWVFADGTWENISASLSVAPSPRGSAGLTYDPAMQALILYGGIKAPGEALDDTWEFNASGWTELHPSLSPPLRTTDEMIYDSADGYVFLWQVNVSSGPQNYWSFQDGTWTNLTSTVTGSLPSATFYGADDPQAGSVLFYGGFTGCPSGLGQTYNYSDGVIRNLTHAETTSPNAAAGSSEMTYVPESDGVILFSGYTASCDLTDGTWLFSNGTWTNLTSEVGSAAPGRWNAPLIYDPAAGGAITFSGNENPVGGANSFGDDTWEYEVPYNPNATVTPLTGNAPLTIAFHANPTNGDAPYRYNWSFDDGSVNSTSASGTHTFLAPGNYTVILSVDDALGQVERSHFTVSVAETGTLAFSQTGLPAGTSWSVMVDGTVWSSISGGVANAVAPGTYSYSVGTVAGFTPTPTTGMATVSTAAVTSVAIAFAATAGWIAGTVTPANASVWVDGTAVTLHVGAFNVSVAGGIHFIEASDPGYATYYNNVTVTGGQTRHVAIVEQVLTTTVTRTTTNFPISDLYAIVGAILVLAVAIIVAAAMLRGRRGKEPPAQAGSSSSMTPPATSPPSGR